MRWFVIVAGLAFVPALARAEEHAVQLKQAPGVVVVEAHCGTCHSLDYVVIRFDC